MQVQNCFSTTKQLTYGYQVYTDGLAILQLTEREAEREKKREKEREREKEPLQGKSQIIAPNVRF